MSYSTPRRLFTLVQRTAMALMAGGLVGTAALTWLARNVPDDFLAQRLQMAATTEEGGVAAAWLWTQFAEAGPWLQRAPVYALTLKDRVEAGVVEHTSYGPKNDPWFMPDEVAAAFKAGPAPDTVVSVEVSCIDRKPFFSLAALKSKDGMPIEEVHKQVGADPEARERTLAWTYASFSPGRARLVEMGSAWELPRIVEMAGRSQTPELADMTLQRLAVDCEVTSEAPVAQTAQWLEVSASGQPWSSDSGQLPESLDAVALDLSKGKVSERTDELKKRRIRVSFEGLSAQQLKETTSKWLDLTRGRTAFVGASQSSGGEKVSMEQVLMLQGGTLAFRTSAVQGKTGQVELEWVVDAAPKTASAEAQAAPRPGS